jgi:hypothetical protein
MSSCYQGHTNSNEKERNATNSEMQSNTNYYYFEYYGGQKMGRMVNQNRLHDMLINEGDEYGIRYKQMPIRQS